MIKKSIAKLLLLASVFAVALYSPIAATAAPETEGYADGRPAAKYRLDAQDAGVVLKHGDGPNQCDYLGARDVWVWESGGTYLMHYDGAGTNGWLACLATSQDLTNWTKFGPVLQLGKTNAGDSASASYGTTYFDGTNWQMFYLGTRRVSPAPNFIPATPYVSMKAFANSPSGPWTKQPFVVPFRCEPGTYFSDTASPGFIVRQGDEYLMFFSAAKRTAGKLQRTLGIARTKNLNAAWTPDAQPIVPATEQIENSSLYFEPANQTWFLFCNHVGIESKTEFTDAVWVYWTKDLNHWNPDDKAVVLDGSNCQWSRKCIGLPSVVKVGNRLAVFYDAPGGDRTSHMQRDVGLAWLKLPLTVPASLRTKTAAVGVVGQVSGQKIETPAQRAARMAWWRAARFGMFIHYGPVSLTGKELSWSRANSNTNCPNHGPTPVAVYDNLYKTFNPTNFNAADWAGVAKTAGMKYVVLTAKHCDGFLLWDSKVDGYNIGATPFKRDLCAELADAVRKDGLHMGWYFSPMDWRDPDCRSTNNDRFVAHIQDELRELLTNYGKIDVLWFDSDGRPTMWHPETTYPLVRGLQPQIIIDNRLQLDTNEQWRHQELLKLRANEDFYTPEQHVGAYDETQSWESCMTLGTQWSWKPNDKIKSAAEVIGILAQTVGGDGNLLLDAGPMPDGRIEPRQVEVLKQVGAWMDVNGESIYGTRGGPWKPTGQIASTRKDDVVYVDVLKAAGDTIELPSIPRKIISAMMLGGRAIKTEVAHGMFILYLPENLGPLPVVIKLELDGTAMEIPAMDAGGNAANLPGSVEKK